MTNILCISIDGLHNGMIGAMGNGWVQTPALDSLAGQAVLFDRFYAETLRLSGIFESLWSTMPRDFETILLTDDEDVFLHEKAGDFDCRHRLPPVQGREPVETLEDTQFFRSFATIVDLIERRKKRAKPFFLWTHLQGFRGGWDFPLDYRERYRDEDDPAPYEGVTPPEIDCPDGAEEIDPDDLQAVMEAYAGGVSVLDDSLAGLLDYLDDENPPGTETLLVFLSTRGFSLGEHRRIGADGRLYGENLQLPLIVRIPSSTPGQNFSTVRSSMLTRMDDLAEFLSDREGDSLLYRLAREEIDDLPRTLQAEGDDGEAAIITPEWFLRKTTDTRADDPRFELYAKPDDRWEANDVADRCPNILEELTPLFTASPSHPG